MQEYIPGSQSITLRRGQAASSPQTPQSVWPEAGNPLEAAGRERGEQLPAQGLDAAASREGSSILPAGTNAKAGLHLTEPDKSNNHRLVGKLLAFQQRLINSDSIKSLLINYAERYYCRLEHGIIIGLTTVYKNEM